MKVRALYSCEDLETTSIAVSSRTPKAIGLVQGRHQLVLGDFVEVVHVSNLLQLGTSIVRLEPQEPSLPILGYNARWLRDDVSVTRVVHTPGTTLFKIENVRTPQNRIARHAHLTVCCMTARQT